MRQFVGPVIIAVALFTSLGLSYMAVRSPPTRAGLLVDTPSHDFGSVKPGPVTHTFTLTNATGKDIVFDGVATGCGCTVVDIPSKRLAKGQQLPALCAVDTRGRRGAFTSNFTIIYREVGGNPQEKALTVELRADVIPVVDVTPRELVFTLDHRETQQLRVVGSDSHVKVFGVRADHPSLVTRVREGGSEIDVEFNAPRWSDPEGETWVEIETDCEEEKRIRIPVYVVSAPGNT